MKKITKILIICFLALFFTSIGNAEMIDGIDVANASATWSSNFVNVTVPTNVSLVKIIFKFNDNSFTEIPLQNVSIPAQAALIKTLFKFNDNAFQEIDLQNVSIPAQAALIKTLFKFNDNAFQEIDLQNVSIPTQENNITLIFVHLNNAMWTTELARPPFITTETIMNVTMSKNDTLFETINVQNATLNTIVTGNLSGTINFTNLEFVFINSGAFKGEGFSTGNWTANIEGSSYNGTWEGMLFKKSGERKIYLKGIFSGGLRGISEGYLTESVNGSGIYDQYHATWTVSNLGNYSVFAKTNLNGSLNYRQSINYSSELYVLQTSIEGNTSGHYEGSLSVVLTHVRIKNETNPYYGRGFSIISYVSTHGSGEAWTYDKAISPNKVEINGLSTDPLLGILSGRLDENTSSKTLSISIEKIDLASVPMTDLKVKVWGPERISPGQTVDYIIEYRNDGLIEAKDVVIHDSLSPHVEYVPGSDDNNSNYAENTSEFWKNLGDVKPQETGLLSIRTKAKWGLSQGTNIENNIGISTSSKEKNTVKCKGKEINTTSWRNNLQVGDILLDHGESFSSKVIRFFGPSISHWNHAGGVVNGTYTDNITGITSTGWFVIEALPRGVVSTKIEHWDYPNKDNVEILRVNGLTPENKNYIADFWSKQIGKPYQFNYLWPKDSSIDATDWYCSELVWAPYYNKGINMDSFYLSPIVHPQELHDSKSTTVINSYDYRYCNDAWWKSIIRVAHDPNIKYGPEGYVLSGQKLNYTVEFENEGEGSAFGVYFTDILDEDLNDSTLQIGWVIATSQNSAKNGTVIGNGTYNPQTRTITWFIWDGGEIGPGEGGYVNFNVSVKRNATRGTDVINFATVYFPSVPETTLTNGIVSIVATYQTEGNGTCNCSNCMDCTAALTDNINCYSKVKLTANVTSQSGICINNPENSNNKIFDCEGNKINGTGWNYGVYLENKKNNTIRNCTITNFWYGIYLKNSSNNVIERNIISNNSVGIYSENSSSIINANLVCGNTYLDFNSTNWFLSLGDNNICDKPDEWKDSSTTIGCKNNCSHISEKAKDIFDAVEMLEYLSGERNQLTHTKEYYKFVGNGNITLSDVLALIDKIGIEG